jgi:hypothetical protein
MELVAIGVVVGFLLGLLAAGGGSQREPSKAAKDATDCELLPVKAGGKVVGWVVQKENDDGQD